ncbi:hypothetical protein QYE76_068249 [Lolium multiflorum]|uniref:CCHC-type domain-containing protein n=1 Tax=Lolium multiflorum TaxID=4521 RepID=A0AAD8SEE5_LOLMU|nr:hypothetical protein QYE76_068249 [Lolium multiflorum]
MTKEVGESSGAAAPVSTQYPQYIRDNYTVWATTMMWALESNEIWEAVDPGGDEFKKDAPKYRKDRQALTAICSVMPMDVKQHLISKTSAKEAWETIKTLNLGHARVREAALQTLQKKYENLEMGEDETLDAFASRVATLVNGIRALDEKLEEISIVRRFLRAASPRYLSVVSAIEQCVDLKTLTMDDLVGRFKAHDERMKITYGDVVPDEHVMLTRGQWQVLVAKEKGDKAYDSRSNKEASRPARKYIAGEDEDDASPRRKFDIKKVRCHNCGKLGHFKVDCRKPPKPKERALIAQEEDDGPMMLMLEVCEQKDEEELPPPSPATEIVTDHGLPCVDHVDKLCDEGVVEKQRSAPYPRETMDQASEALELDHGDICGPISPATPPGNEYFMLVVDDHSQYMWIVLLKSKDQGLQAFEKIKEAGEVKARAKKSLRIDRGGELKHKVLAIARSMMESKSLPGKFWGEAVNTAVYLLNRAPTRSMIGGTPYEAWYGRKPSVDHLRTFGCVAHVKTVSSHKRNLADRSTPMIMTGYEEDSKAYRLCNPSTNKVIVTCDVVFEEDLSWIWNSMEPDETFTVVYSDCEHADDQDAGTHADAGTEGGTLRRQAAGSGATLGGARPGGPVQDPPGDGSTSAADKVPREAIGDAQAPPEGADASGRPSPGRDSPEADVSVDRVSPARGASPAPCSLGSDLASLPASHTQAGAPHGRARSSSRGTRSGSPSWLGGPDRTPPSSSGRRLESSGSSPAWGARSDGQDEAQSGGLCGQRSRPGGLDVAAASSSGGAAPRHEAGPRRGKSPGCTGSGGTSRNPKPGASCALTSPASYDLVRSEGQAHEDWAQEVDAWSSRELCVSKNPSRCLRAASLYVMLASFASLHGNPACNFALSEDQAAEIASAGVPTWITPGGSETEVIIALSDAEEYVVPHPTALEMRRPRPTRARMRRVLDYYPKKEFRTVNNPVKMKHTKQCLFIKEPVKMEDADKKGRRQAMEKPAKVKSVTWVSRGTAKAMPRKTPAGSSWRIWDPGRGKVHVVLRG